MDVYLDQREHVRIFVDGKLSLEADGSGLMADSASLEREIKAARCSRNGMRSLASGIYRMGSLDGIEDHVNKPGKERKHAAARGFLDGMAGELDYGLHGASLAPLPPEHSPSYRYGYHCAEAVRRAIKLANDADPQEHTEES